MPTYIEDIYNSKTIICDQHTNKCTHVDSTTTVVFKLNLGQPCLHRFIV